MSPSHRRAAACILSLVALPSGSSCGTPPEPPGDLAPAFAEFDSANVSVVLTGTRVTIESNGLPNHTSPYWSPDHPLFVEPTVTTRERMAPGYIDDFNGSYALTVSASPQLASSSRATGLGPIGIAVSGAMIYNDSEGPGRPLDWAIGSLDYVGAHTGPQSYHYHLEPIAWSEDDENLIGVMADGFFLYGRRDADGSHPDGVVTFQGEPFDGVALRYDDLGSLVERTTYCTGRKDGLAERWHACGTPGFRARREAL